MGWFHPTRGRATVRAGGEDDDRKGARSLSRTHQRMGERRLSRFWLVRGAGVVQGEQGVLEGLDPGMQLATSNPGNPIVFLVL